jgi:hypothetical protein
MKGSVAPPQLIGRAGHCPLLSHVASTQTVLNQFTVWVHPVQSELYHRYGIYVWEEVAWTRGEVR